MSEWEAQIEQAREHVRPSWTAERERRVRFAVDRRRGRRSRVRFTSAAVGASFLIAFALFWIALRPRLAPAVRSAQPAAPSSPLLFRLRDGTTVSALRTGARVEAISEGPSGTTLRLAAGAARFDVAPQHGRTFRVLAGPATVTVIGTRFTIDSSPAGVRVDVERGHVRVDWPGGSADLLAGQHELVPRVPAGDAAVRAAEPDGGGALPTPARGAPAGGRLAAPPPRAPSWRDLAQSGDYSRAYARLAAAPPGAVRDDPGDLLLAADVARLGGHSRVAVRYLKSVVQDHSNDARAPLAAFTLGRVLLDDLGDPRQAAQAFARARQLAPGGPLAQDALAREVEAWSRAGDSTLARRRAEEYLRDYPNGRRKQAVRRLGGLP